MNTNNGTAIKVTLVITPQIRRGNRLNKVQPKPINPNTIEVPSRVNVTGKPAMRRMVSAKNIQAGR